MVSNTHCSGIGPYILNKITTEILIRHQIPQCAGKKQALQNTYRFGTMQQSTLNKSFLLLIHISNHIIYLSLAKKKKKKKNSNAFHWLDVKIGLYYQNNAEPFLSIFCWVVDWLHINFRSCQIGLVSKFILWSHNYKTILSNETHIFGRQQLEVVALKFFICNNLQNKVHRRAHHSPAGSVFFQGIPQA